MSIKSFFKVFKNEPSNIKGYYTFYLGFCGKVYRGVYIITTTISGKNTKKCFYNKESLYKYANSVNELAKLDYYDWYTKNNLLNFLDYSPKNNKILLEYQSKNRSSGTAL